MTYTSHGHHIPGTERKDELGQIKRARCGGVPVCTVCQKDTARHLSPDTPDPDIESFFEDIDGYSDDPERFLKQAKLFVVGAYNNRIPDEEAQISIQDLYIVWWSKVLQNWKAMISTSIPGDGLYFEVTHNGDKQATYVDTYMKISNDEFSPEGNE